MGGAKRSADPMVYNWSSVNTVITISSLKLQNRHFGRKKTSAESSVPIRYQFPSAVRLPKESIKQLAFAEIHE